MVMFTQAISPVLDRRSIMLRAWQLRRWNVGDDRGFRHFLKMAWREWKTGQAAAWSFAAPKADPRAVIEARIRDLEYTDRIGLAGLNELHRLNTELRALRRAAA